MSQPDYVPFVDRMIQRYEGGYGWDRGDSGGPTKYGITCYDLAENRHMKMTSMATWAPIVQAMGLAEAEDIYKKKYAAAVHFDDLPAGPDVVMMDYGVNSGIGRPVAVARAITRVHGVGAMDQALVDAIRKYDPHAFVSAMNSERLQFMHAIQGGRMWARFGGGWGSRVADLTAYANHLASGAPVNAAPAGVDISHLVQPKATHVAKTATIQTSGGVLSTPALHLLGLDVAEIAMVAGAVIAAGVGYEAWQASRAAKLNATVILPAGV